MIWGKWTCFSYICLDLAYGLVCALLYKEVMGHWDVCSAAVWCLWRPFDAWHLSTHESGTPKSPIFPCEPVCLYRSSCLLFFCLFGTVLAKMQDPLCLFRLVLAWSWLSGRPSAPASTALPRSSIQLCVPSFSGCVLASEVWILQIAEI